MKLIVSRVYAAVFLLSFCASSWAQASTQPIEATLCDLYQHPDQCAGKMVGVRGTIPGNDMWIDAFTEKPCSSWMSIVVVFPNQVKPAPDFDLVKDDSCTTYRQHKMQLESPNLLSGHAAIACGWNNFPYLGAKEGSAHFFRSRRYCASGIWTSSGLRAGSSQARSDSIFSCGMAVQPTVPCPGPRHMCMKIQEPAPASGGLLLWSTTMPQR